MKADIKIEGGRILVSLDLPFDQASLDKITSILACGVKTVQHKYSNPVSESPTNALADMFACVEYLGVVVTKVHFPKIAQPVIEAHEGFENGNLWRARCTFDHDENHVLVVGDGIEVCGLWE